MPQSKIKGLDELQDLPILASILNDQLNQLLRKICEENSSRHLTTINCLVDRLKHICKGICRRMPLAGELARVDLTFQLGQESGTGKVLHNFCQSTGKRYRS